ncbi:PLDc_N domain-containing protein [Algoriphagus aestuariicola]|uniref:PLDc_N domain-containing protein n=1 Tax=Algoriphagus aestuariicola TaxID=1852016 RepID=A0ABS3BVH5_9BACT|nr:PLD nuclease N-terminal domain-containing protein [Algoriphagus aestuariicola]MBN7802296.1 PLDc_N domain-containing protein [Algoriphagus aestuariicola]
MNLTFIYNVSGGTILLFALIYFVLWVYCLVDIIRSDFRDPNMKLIWIVVLLLGQGVGPLIYLILGRGTKRSANA